jgi:hypothetical protein
MDKQTHEFLYQAHARLTDKGLIQKARNAHKNMKAYTGKLNIPQMAKNEYNIIAIAHQIAMHSRPQILKTLEQISNEAYKLIA